MKRGQWQVNLRGVEKINTAFPASIEGRSDIQRLLRCGGKAVTSLYDALPQVRVVVGVAGRRGADGVARSSDGKGRPK